MRERDHQMRAPLDPIIPARAREFLVEPVIRPSRARSTPRSGLRINIRLRQLNSVMVVHLGYPGGSLFQIKELERPDR